MKSMSSSVYEMRSCHNVCNQCVSLYVSYQNFEYLLSIVEVMVMVVIVVMVMVVTVV